MGCASSKSETGAIKINEAQPGNKERPRSERCASSKTETGAIKVNEAQPGNKERPRSEQCASSKTETGAIKVNEAQPGNKERPRSEQCASSKTETGAIKINEAQPGNKERPRSEQCASSKTETGAIKINEAQPGNKERPRSEQCASSKTETGAIKVNEAQPGNKERPRSEQCASSKTETGAIKVNEAQPDNKERPRSGQCASSKTEIVDIKVNEVQPGNKEIPRSEQYASSKTEIGATKINEVQPGNKKGQRIGQSIKDEFHQYEKIDEHARRAPNSVKNSADELVNYMSSVSKDPKMLVRGFFVWISENIRYDVDGFFGRAQRVPCDAESVMKGGKSVCEGYARVMELLCRQAGIPEKKISGYAKGYGHSAANPFTFVHNVNHAWNAVKLKGKWYLIDSTWGAGHLDDSNSFKKKFDDFYFLTDPKHFISTHFPYMEKDRKESQKWQLLSKPISLYRFNKNLKYWPEAFKVGAQAVSHQQEYIEMENELEITFKSVKKEELAFSARLMLKEGNRLLKQPNATFGYPENGLYKLKIHPPKPGSYMMDVFGKAVSDESLEGIQAMMDYTINCTAVKERDFEYPIAYAKARTEKCILHEPLRGKLPRNTEIKFCVAAPYLQNVRVGKTYLEKSGTMFSGNISTGEVGQKLIIFCTRGEKYSRMHGLYGFQTV